MLDSPYLSFTVPAGLVFIPVPCTIAWAEFVNRMVRPTVAGGLASLRLLRPGG